MHDTIFAYRKTAPGVFRKLYTPLSDQRVARHYGQVESGTGRRYGLYDFTQSGQGKPRRFGDRVIAARPAGKHWIWEQDRIDAAMSEGRIVFTSKNMVRVKRYLDESTKQIIFSVKAGKVTVLSTVRRLRLERFYPWNLQPHPCVEKQPQRVSTNLPGGSIHVSSCSRLQISWAGRASTTPRLPT